MSLTLKRALRVFGAVAGWLGFGYGWGYLLYRLEESEIVIPGGFVEAGMEMVFLGGVILIPAFALYYRHKRRDLWIKEEADRWLADRSAPLTERARIWSKRLRRTMLLTPSAFALLVFLFLPEAMGVTSHLFLGTSFVLAHHRLRPPLTSFIQSYRNLYVHALLGRGIGRVGFLPYWRGEPPLWDMFFYANPDPHNHWRETYMAREKTILARTLPFGNETLTCWEILSRSEAAESDPIRIECLTSQNDLGAQFYGPRVDAAVFYDVIANATEAK